jgi:hypothetical protein
MINLDKCTLIWRLSLPLRPGFIYRLVSKGRVLRFSGNEESSTSLLTTNMPLANQA